MMDPDWQPPAPKVPKELDPNGLALNTPGAKADAGKPMAHLVLAGFPRALQAVIAVGTHGAEKYSPNGWQQVPFGVERYMDAAMRHYLAEQIEGPIDGPSGCRHKAQVIWNLLAALELELRGVESSPSPGVSP